MSTEAPYDPEPNKKVIISAQELRQLTLFKWRYSLQAGGFTRQQAEILIFMKWLRATGVLNEDGHRPGFRLTDRYRSRRSSLDNP